MDPTIKLVADFIKKYPSKISELTRLAQFVVETGAGTSELFKNSNNGFGIKASAPWDGEVYNHNSPEGDRSQFMVKSGFRKYPSIEASVRDHAGFFTSTPRREKVAYAPAINAVSPKEEMEALAGVYAGNKSYGKKLWEAVISYDLKAYFSDGGISKFEKKGNDIMAQLRTPIKRHTLVNKGGKIGKIKYIVIHFVGASGQARANADYFYNVFRSASAHFFIDPYTTYEVVPEDTVGWHVGDGMGRFGITNQNSIGIEGCQDVTTGKDVWHWDFHKLTYEQMLLLTSHLMDKHNVPIENVVRHYDASRKICPGNWQWNGWAKWWKFKKDLQALRAGKKVIESPVAKPGATNKYNPKGYTETPMNPFRQPAQAFKAYQVGDEVTIRKGINWYNPETNKFIVSPLVSKHYGTKRKIKQIKEVKADYSTRAYLLEGVLSWVLEQDIEESRAHWDKGVSASKYVVQKGDTLWAIANKFKVTVDDIKAWNHISTNIISIGQTLFVVKPAELVEVVTEKPVAPVEGTTPAKEQPKDTGEKTLAIPELKPGQLLTHDGKIIEYVIKEN